MPERHRDKASTELGCFELDLTTWIADQPCLMPVRIQPVDLEAGAILLAAPAATALYVKNIQVGWTVRCGGACPHAHVAGRSGQGQPPLQLAAV